LIIPVFGRLPKYRRVEETSPPPLADMMASSLGGKKRFQLKVTHKVEKRPKAGITRLGTSNPATRPSVDRWMDGW
jgi:hypothetical protein